METHCTRPGCPRPLNVFPDLDDRNTFKTVQQKFCTTCGMPQILIGRYIPIKLLGRGGFGAAFLAIDRYTPTMRQCVVKQFQPSGDLSPDQLELAQNLFEREAEALEKLGNPHPQIPDLFAFFELSVPSSTPGQPTQFFYLVQAFIDGQNMEQELAQRGAFAEAEVLEILREVLKILKFVHTNGSIHRDIKPSNIMRDRSGQIHLLDFGAVKLITSGQAVGKTQRSTGIYSMGYAPPEQMAGGVVYPATDLYALAVTCITLLTGKQPTELYDAYSNTWNWRAYTQVSDLLEAVLNRMLLPTPSDRFQSADEVMTALKRRSPSPTKSSAASPPPPPPLSRPSSSASAPSASPSSRPAPSASPSPRPSSSVSPPTPSPPAPTPSPSAPASSQSSSLATFPLISGAAFLGFELGLIAIATISAMGLSPMGLGVLAIATVLLVTLLVRRVIEKIDLVILMGLSMAIALLVEIFGSFAVIQSSPFLLLILLPSMLGLLFLAGAIVFLLIYRLLAQLL